METRAGCTSRPELREAAARGAFTKVYTSRLHRARRSELAGFGDMAEIDPDLVEWNYGEYEGLQTEHIRAERPDWQLFRDGCPSVETPQQVVARADCVIGGVCSVNADVLVFSSGHFIRMFVSRWLGLEPSRMLGVSC